MRTYFLLVALAHFAAWGQNMKDASSDKAAVIEGRLRDAQPDERLKLKDGTDLSVWLLSVKDSTGNGQQQLLKATAQNEVAAEKEGLLSFKADFIYEKGVLSSVLYNETTVIQHPTPKFYTIKKELQFTDGLQTSPAVGSLPEIEALIARILPQIEQLRLKHSQK